MATRNFHIDQVVAGQIFSQKQISQILTWTECQMKSKIVFEPQGVGTVSDHSLWRGRAIYRSCQNFSIIGWVSFHLSPFVCVSFITSLQSILCSVLNTQNTTDNNGIISHAQNTTALQPDVFLITVYLSLFSDNGRPFPNCKQMSRSSTHLSSKTSNRN